MTGKHKHSELIKAWADGAQIEYRDLGCAVWVEIDHPNWKDDVEYRIKPTPPAKQYPVTAMTNDEIDTAFVRSTNKFSANVNSLALANTPVELLRMFIDMAIRHAIDNGQVAPLEAYQKCAADLLKAEETIRTLNDEIIRMLRSGK